MKRYLWLPPCLLFAALSACTSGDSRNRTPTATPNLATVFAQGSFPTPTGVVDIPTTIQKVPVVWSTSPQLPPLVELSKAKEPDDPFSRGYPGDPKPGDARDWSVIVSDLADNERVLYNGPHAIESGVQSISEDAGVITAHFITTESIPFLGNSHSFETYGFMDIEIKSGALTQHLQPFDPAQEISDTYAHGNVAGVQIASLSDGAMLVLLRSGVSRPSDAIWPAGLYRVAPNGTTAQLKGVTGLDELTPFAGGKAILAWGPSKTDPRKHDLYIIPVQNGQAFSISNPLAWAIQDPGALSSLYPMPSTRVAVLIQEKGKACCGLDLFDAETFALNDLATVRQPAVASAMSFRGDFVNVGDQRVNLTGAVGPAPATPTPAPRAATPTAPSTSSQTPPASPTPDPIQRTTFDSPGGRYTVIFESVTVPAKQECNSLPTRLSIRDNDSGGTQVLADCPGGRHGVGNGAAEWLDSTHFLVTLYSLSPSRIFLIGDAVSGALTPLTEGFSARKATLSEDGSRLLLDGTDLRVFDISGHLLFKRPTPAGYHISSAIWLQDGRIAFVQEPSGWTPFRE